MINKSAESMISNFNKRFNDIEERIMVKMQTLEDTQTQEIREMSREIKKLQILPDKIDELNKRVTDGEVVLKSTLEAQQEAIVAGQRRIAALEEKLANLPDSTGYSPTVIKKMDDLEQRLKNRSLLINGLNERFQNENGILGLAAEVLNVHLEYTDIDEIVNLGKNQAEQTVTKVTFTSMWARTSYYRARSSLKNTGLRIWINEDLAPEKLKIATAVRLQVKARKLFKSWTNMGITFAKISEMGTPAKLETQEEIEALIATGTAAGTVTNTSTTQQTD